MNSGIVFLKVKIKSLAEEQGIIRLEKARAKERRRYLAERDPAAAQREAQLIDSLHLHRIDAVRPEIRAALFAYGLLRGRTPEQIEPKAKRPVDQGRVNQLIRKYGTPDDKTRLRAA